MLHVNDLDDAKPGGLGAIFRRGESLLVEAPGPHQPRMLPVPAGNAPCYGFVRVVPPMHMRVHHPKIPGNCQISGIYDGRFISVHDLDPRLQASPEVGSPASKQTSTAHRSAALLA